MKLVVVEKGIAQLLQQKRFSQIDSTTIRQLRLAKILLPLEEADFEDLEKAREFFQKKDFRCALFNAYRIL